MSFHKIQKYFRVLRRCPKSKSMKEYSTPSCFKQEGPQYSSLGVT